MSEAKKKFYKQYDYLKPECEKSEWEKFRDTLEDVGEWCKEHWKEIVLAIEIIVAVVCLFVPGLQGIGTGILIGALKGAITGGLIGGITSALSGGSFLEGFAQGALDGVIMGGALGDVGGIAGKFITCGSKLGNAIQTTAKVSGTISDGMDGFDMLSIGLGMIDPNNPITELNSKLHQSDVYNSFQMGVSMVSSFTGAASQNMACFIAGTMVLTTAGLVAIEKLKAGDVVITTNPDTLETAGKPVLETYVRQVNKLVHITINGEEIVTTDNHPFYVQNRGFIEAGNLLVGDKLISINGEDLIVDELFVEETAKPVDVYNFQVEDFHTYFVGELSVWVHNAECTPKEFVDSVESGETVLNTTKQKGNYGEMKMDQYYDGQGYERVSLDSIESLDDPIHHGIDGVYHKADGNPPYIVAESKFGTSQLGTTKSSGKQMSDQWISDRLQRAVGSDLADEILFEGYGKELVRIDVGKVTVKTL